MAEEWDDEDKISTQTASIKLKPSDWEDEDKDEVADEWDAEPKKINDVIQTHKPKSLSKRKLEKKRR